MKQVAELIRVKARIKALAEKTVSNGCTEAEAMAAAAHRCGGSRPRQPHDQL